MPSWTLTAAIDNGDIWGKCLHAQSGNQGSVLELWKIFLVLSIQSSKHLSYISKWLAYLWAWQAQFRKLEVSCKPRGPRHLRVARITEADDLAMHCASMDQKRERAERWLNTIQWSHWWANIEANTKKNGANSMKRVNQKFTEERLLQRGLEGWIGVRQLHRNGAERAP